VAKIFMSVAGPVATNGYVVYNEHNQAVVFDPSQGSDELIAFIKKNNLQLTALLLTHAHFDHIMGIDEVLDSCGSVPVYIHPLGIDILKDPLKNGSFLIGMEYRYTKAVEQLSMGEQSIGPFCFAAHHLPGHSTDSAVFDFGDFVVAGDTLFAGSVGRTDLPGGSSTDLFQGIVSILFAMPDDTIVYPGHGEATTIGQEKQTNPYFARYAG